MRGTVQRRLGVAVAALATAGLLATGSLAPAHADRGHGGGHGGGHGKKSGQFDVVHDGFMKSRTTLKKSDPRKLGLDPEPIRAAWEEIDGYAQPDDPETKPLYASNAAVMGHQGKIVSEHYDGVSRLYADGEGTELPPEEQIEAEQDTIYDMASVSKLFTSIVIMQLVEDGQVDLDATYASYVPEFGNHGKEVITIRQMLTHTSGLVAFIPLWKDYDDKESRIQAVMDIDLNNPPGEVYEYSDLNLISLGVLAEQLTGKSLDTLVAEGITEPLKMKDTGYNPDQSKLHRVAATEYQAEPDRGVVWGEVHDENAWSLGGVAGHAGIFSTTADMSILAQTMLNGGSYKKHRILSEDSVTAMITNENADFGSDAHGLGFELNQLWYMGGLAGPTTAGHTGYTGTSLVIDFQSRSFVVLLTNGVHPSREWGSTNPARRAASGGLARALAVNPQKGRTAWYGGAADKAEATLTAEVAGGDDVSLTFDVFADNERTDEFALESSADGGKTWELLPYKVRTGKGRHGRIIDTDGTYNNQGSRDWGHARASVPEGTELIRWRYTTDSNTQGRGVFVDDITARDGHRVILKGERNPDALTADGFSQVRR
ncbi:MAG: serine hydrolase [Propionibacteriaceae bacterium]